MIEIIQTARSIIPATHLRKTGISVPPYVFILKAVWSQLYYGVPKGGIKWPPLSR